MAGRASKSIAMEQAVGAAFMRRHLKSYDMWTTGIIVSNTIAIVFFTIVCLAKFFDNDHYYLRDAFGVALPNTLAAPTGPLARTAVLYDPAGAHSTTCSANVHPRACNVGTLQYYKIGSAGMLNDLTPGVPVHAFDTMHVLWTASWYATPLSLLLLASTLTSQVTETMWSGLYLLIATWNLSGLAVQLLIKTVPLYNVYFTIVSFIFSCLLVVALREVERANADVEEISSVVVDPKNRDHAQFMSLKRQPYARVRQQPTTFEASEAAPTRDIIRGVHRSYSVMSIIVLQLFFLAPAFLAVVSSLAQDRMTGAMMQQVYWSTTFFLSAVVLLQRASLLESAESVAQSSYMLLAISTAIGFVLTLLPLLSVVGQTKTGAFHLAGPTVVVSIMLLILVAWLVLEVFRNPMPWMDAFLSNETFHKWHHIGNMLIMLTLVVTHAWWGVVALQNKFNTLDPVKEMARLQI
jgi:hypothetical protein